ncbi:zinc ribbon domain-containing protein [Methanobrevibacter sp.]|uniref:zinc ribbon domain-containing protein n=1 Tax=Methanobrevibacter sp. TaxID=66852 RepID=UPI00386C0E92
MSRGMSGLILLLFFGGGIYIIIRSIVSTVPHFRIPKGVVLDPYAKIVDISTVNDSAGYRHGSLKTTVTFSDGTFYDSHLTKSRPHWGYFTLYVDDEAKTWIANKAIKKHSKKCGLKKNIQHTENYYSVTEYPQPSSISTPTENDRCNNCGSQLKPSARFCSVCGEKVLINTVHPRFCSCCGRELKDGAKYCRWCGSEV